MARVSVIILTWNHLDYTKKAVESLIPILHSDDEVIFVDNLSTDGTVPYLNSLSFPCKKYVITPSTNRSIAAAYNIGIDNSSGNYIFLYDNDMQIVQPHTLDHMVNVFAENLGAGIVTPFSDNIMGRVRSCPSPEHLPLVISEVHAKRNRPYPYCPSAGWLISRECINKVGTFDERFTGYGILDFDYAKRVLESGMKILSDGFVFIKHYGSITAKDYLTPTMLTDMSKVFYDKWDLGLGVPKGMIRRR